ncbi:MAG: hypothetical protein GF313_12025 [Caldithrix sp.]|nr:hypothetical protein [Caldithrix sp.]
MIITVILFAGGITWAGNERLTNTELMEKLLKRDIDSVLKPVLTNQNISSIKLLVQNMPKDKHLFLKYIFSDVLDNYSMQLSNADSALSITVFKFDVDVYYKEHAKTLLGLKAQNERIIQYNFSGFIENGYDQGFSRKLEFNNTFNDVVDEPLEKLDSKNFPFLKGNIVKSTPWTIIFEPLIIISSIGTVVYLFYSMRS